MEHHEMMLMFTDSLGYETWHCPLCGHSFSVRWQPYDMSIWHIGDETVAHISSRGALSISVSQGIGEPWDSFLWGLDKC